MTTELQDTVSPRFDEAPPWPLAQTLDIKIASDVKSLMNQIVKISTVGGLNRFRYERIRAPLIDSERIAGLIPNYVHEIESTVGIYAYFRPLCKYIERRDYIEKSFSRAVNILEFDTLSDEHKLFLREGNFDDHDASVAYMNSAFALAETQPDRSLDMCRQLLLHATCAFCMAYNYACSEDEPLATLLSNALSQHLSNYHGVTERRYNKGYKPYWQGLRSMAEYVSTVTQAHIGSYGDRFRKSASAEEVVSICNVSLMLSTALTIWPHEATTKNNGVVYSRYLDQITR